jgi:hypothetical protein
MLHSNRREDWKMRHSSLMLFIGVAAAGISVSPACATVRIISDPGGAVIDYLERFEAARVSGEPIIIAERDGSPGPMASPASSPVRGPRRRNPCLGHLA